MYMCTHVHLNNYTLPSPGISSLTGGPALTPTRQLLTQVTLAEWGERDILPASPSKSSHCPLSPGQLRDGRRGMMDSLLKVTNLLIMTNLIMIFLESVRVPPCYS